MASKSVDESTEEGLSFATQRETLVQAIERDQEEVRDAAQQLADVAGSKLDVGERIKAFPLTWVLGAFLVGVWLGSRGGPIAVTERRRP